MTHLEEYNRIIEFRKANPIPVEQYGEEHHIKPRSIYPELVNDKSNIVRLSAQEHFLAHYHLWKAYKDELHEKEHAKKMRYAFIFMKRQLLQCDDIKTLAKLYEEARIECTKTENNPMYGKHHSNKTRRKMSNTHKGKHLSAQARKKLSEFLKGNTRHLNKHHSEEARKKMSQAHKDKPLTEEHKRRLAEANKGRHWYNNGYVNVFTRKCPNGFVEGQLNKKVKRI